MGSFILQALLFFIVFQFGKAAGRVESRIALGMALQRGKESYDKVIKLAELKGEDPSKLSPEEIAIRIKKYEEAIKDEGDIY